MEGVKNIKSKIKKDAEKEAKKHIKEAEKEAKKLKEVANTEIKKEKTKIKEDAKKKAEQEKQRIHSSANLEIHNLELEMQETLIQETFEKAKKKISNLQGKKRYEKALQGIIEESLKDLGKKNVNLHVSKKDKKLGKKLAKKFKIKTGDFLEDMEGGAILEKKDGSLRIDNSVEQRFERQKAYLRGEVADLLFKQKK